MDPLSLFMAVFMAFGVISADAVLHSDSVSVSLHMPEELAKSSARGDVVEDMFIAKMAEIAAVNSFFGQPSIQSTRAKTLGVALAKTLKVEDIAAAIQHTFGMKTASVLGSFAKDDKDGALQLIAMVRDPDEPPFALVVRRQPGQSLPEMVSHAAEQVMEHLAPYVTVVFLMHEADASRDFSKVDDLISRELLAYAATSHYKERAAILNIAGIVALHKNDMTEATRLFEEADRVDPELVLPRLNQAFVLLVTDHERGVEAVIKPAMDTARRQRAYMLLAAGDIIRAGAFMSQGDFDKADAALEDAEYWDPGSSIVPTLRAEMRAERGDLAGAQKHKAEAFANLDKFETYPELASLYFHISWRKGEPLRRNNLRVELGSFMLAPPVAKTEARKLP